MRRVVGDPRSELLDAGAAPKAACQGLNALHLSAALGNAPAVKLLLQAGVDPNAQSLVDGNGWTPLHLAALQGSEAVIAALIEAGADVDAFTHLAGSPLICSALVSQALGEGGQVGAAKAG